jgi:hypothetical protein
MVVPVRQLTPAEDRALDRGLYRPIEPVFGRLRPWVAAVEHCGVRIPVGSVLSRSRNVEYLASHRRISPQPRDRFSPAADRPADKIARTMPRPCRHSRPARKSPAGAATAAQPLS